MPEPSARQETEIERIDYDAQTRTLHVKYKDGPGGPEHRGWSFQYHDVPPHLYQGLKASATPIDFLKSEIESVCGQGVGMLCLKRLMSAKEGRERIAQIEQFKRDQAAQ